MSRDRVNTSGKIVLGLIALLFVIFLCFLQFTEEPEKKKKPYCGDICEWVPYQPDDCQCSLESAEIKDKIEGKTCIFILFGFLVFFICLIYLIISMTSCLKREDDVEASQFPEENRNGGNASFLIRATAPYFIPHFEENDGGNFNQAIANDLPPEYQHPPTYNDVKRY